MRKKEDIQIYLNRIQSKVATVEDFIEGIKFFEEYNNYSKILGLANQGIERFPDDGIFHYWAAFAFFHLEKDNEAFNNINVAISKNADHKESILLGVEIANKLGDHENALMFIKLGLKRFADTPELPDAIYHFFDEHKEFISANTDILTIAYKNGEDRVGDFLFEIFYTGKLSTEDALDVYIKKFDLRKEDENFVKFLSALIIQKKRTDDKAINVLFSIYNNGWKTKEIVTFLADHFSKRSLWDDEYQMLYEHAVEFKTATYYVFKLLGQKYILLQQENEVAFSVIFQYFLFEPDNKDTILYLIPFMLKKKKYDTDEKNFLKIAYRLFPDNFEIFKKIVENMLFDIKETIEYIPLLQRYLEENPKSESAIKLLGRAYLELERKDSEALFIYEKFVRFETNNKELISILTEYYLNENRKNRLAIIIYEKAYQLNIESYDLYKILGNYYLERGIIKDDYIPIFKIIYNDLKADEVQYKRFITQTAEAILEKKVTLKIDEFFFDILKNSIESGNENETLEKYFIKIGIELKKIDNASFELYKKLYLKYKSNKHFLNLLYSAYDSRNFIDDIGKEVFEVLYMTLKDDNKDKATILLSQYYIDNKIRDDFSSDIIARANELRVKGIKIEGNLEKGVQFAVKANKKNLSSLDIFYKYLQINEDNPAVYRSACEIIIENNVYDKKYLSILKNGINLYPGWKELFNHYAITLAKNKIRDNDSYPIWEKYILAGNKDNTIIIELLSYYINNQTLDAKAEKVFKYALDIGYKNAQTLLQYAKILSINGNYEELLIILKEVIKYDITETEDIKFICDTFLFYAAFDLLIKFLNKYSEKSPMIIWYKIKALFYSEKLAKNEELMENFIKNTKFTEKNADIFEIYGDYYFYKKSDFNRAFKGYKYYLKVFPNDPLVLYKATLCSLKLNDLYTSLKYVKKLLLFRENDIEAQKIAGDIHFQLAEWNEASQFYKRIIGNGYKDREILKNYAQSLFMSQQYYAAIDLFKEILYIEPINEKILLSLTYAYTSIDFKEETVATLEKIIALNPNSKEALFALFTIYLEDKKIDKKAEYLYELVLNVDPENLDAIKMLGAIYSKLGRKDDRAIDVYTKTYDYGELDPNIVKILANKVVEESEGTLHKKFSIKILKDAVDIFPSSDKYWTLLIDFIVNEANFSDYKNYFEKAFKRGIRIFECSEKLAEIYYRKEDYEQALFYAKTALLQNPYKSKIYNLMGEIYILKEDYVKAKALLDNAIIYDSDNFYAYLNYAKVMAFFKNYPLAIRNLEKALTINKYYLPAILLYAKITVERESNLKKSKELLNFVKDIYPGNWEITYWLTTINKKLGDIDLAIIQIREAISIEKNPETILLYSDLLWENDEKGNAINFLSQNCEEMESPDIYNKLGQFFYAMNNIDRAKESFSEAVRIDPNFIDTKIELAKLHYNIDKDLETAKVEFQNILEFNPGNIIAKRYLGKINYRMKKYDVALKIYREVFEFLDYDDTKFLVSINFTKKNYDEVLELSSYMIRQNAQDVDILSILFETYKNLQLYDKAIEIFEKLKFVNSKRADEYFGEYFGILLSSANFENLRTELTRLKDDDRYRTQSAEYYFFLEYLLYGTKFKKLQQFLPYMIKKQTEEIDYKKNRDLMLFHILLQEGAFSSIDSLIHLFNKNDKPINFLTGVYYLKTNRLASALNIMASFNDYWSYPYFQTYLTYIKDLLPNLKEGYRFKKIWELLSSCHNRNDITYWHKLFFKFAEDKFKEKFYQKKNIKKSFKLLLERIERYETVQGSKDSDIDSDLVVKMFQYYNFLAGNYKDCLKLSKKYKFEGILFLSNLYSELLRKKQSKKKLLQIINKNMTDGEIPYFYDFLCKENLTEIAKVRVLEMKENKLNDNFYEIIYDLYSKNIIEGNAKLDKLLQNSNSFNLRYLIRKGDYENAYKIIMKMNYLEFISNENAAYIMEVMRQVEDYDQLLTYKYRFIDSSFINDDTNLYYAIALSKFSFEDMGTSLLATVNFENITFINALSAIGNKNQYPHDNLIEKFLENYHNHNEVLEFFSFLKDFDKKIVVQYEDKLKEILPQEEFNILKGRIAFIQGKQEEAKELLKESDHYEDLRLLIPLSTDIEAKNIVGRVVKKINKKREYFENYKTFLPFSYKNIYLHKARNDLFTFNFQLFEILSNLHDLTGKLEIGNVITKFDPTQLHIYKELYYIYMDFQQDFSGALRILNKMLSLNPRDSELVIEKGKLLINEGRYDYALSFLFENKGLSNDILNYIADIYEKQGLVSDAIDINKELLEKTDDIKYFVRIMELKYNLELYDEVIDIVEDSNNNFHSEMITYFLGMSYYNLKDFEKAKELLTAIIFSDFKYKDNLNIIIGLIHFNLKDYANSQIFMKKAIKNKKSEEIAWSKLADILLNGKSKNIPKAVATLEKAAEKGANDTAFHLLSAEIYYTSKNRQKLVQDLRFLSKNPPPDTVDNHLRYGKILYKTGKVQKAEVEFLRVIDLQSENYEALKYLIDIYLEEKSYLKCLPLVTRAFEKKPVNVAFTYATVLFAIGRYEEARNIAKNIKETSSEIEFFKGKLYYELKSYEESIARFQFILNENPKSFEANLYLGKIYYALFNLQKAVELLKIAESINENDFEVLKYLGLSYNKLGDTINTIIFLKKALSVNAKDHEIILELAQLYFNKKRYKEAIKEFKRVISIKYNLPAVHFRLAKAYRYLEDYSNALIYINNALDFNPMEEIFIEEKINILTTSDDTEQIITTLIKYEEKNKLNPILKYTKIKNMRLNNHFSAALRELEEYEIPNSLEHDFKKEKALILYQLKRYDEAINLLNALYKDSKDDEIFITLCFTLIELDKVSRIKSLIINYKGDLLKTEYIPYILGYVALKDGQKEIALNYFYQSITVNKGFVPAYRRLIETYIKGKNYIMAIDIIKDCLRYEKIKRMDLYYYLGISYYYLNDYFKAMRYIKEALSWDYLNSASLLSEIYEKTALYGYGIIITKRLWIENRIDSKFAWEQIIHFLFMIGRQKDAVIESFYNFSSITDQKIIEKFTESLLEFYKKPYAAYIILKRILKIDQKHIKLLSLYIYAISGINVVDTAGNLNMIRNLADSTANPDLIEALGVYYYKKGEMLLSSSYLQKAIRLNPDSDKALYYLSLLK